MANNDEEMKNSQILAAGMLCNLTANFKHNKLCFLEKDGIKYASVLAKRVLATMSSDHSDEHVRLAIPLLGKGLFCLKVLFKSFRRSPKQV